MNDIVERLQRIVEAIDEKPARTIYRASLLSHASALHEAASEIQSLRTQLDETKDALEHLLKVRTRTDVRPQSRNAAEAKARRALNGDPS